MPPGNALSASAGSMPASRAPAMRAVCGQPSNGTCSSAAFSRASRWTLRSTELAFRQFGRFGAADRRRALGQAVSQLLGERQQAEIGHALGIEEAVKVVALVLHHAGVKAAGLALDVFALQPESVIADAGPARHRAGEPRDREAGLPAGGRPLAQQPRHRDDGGATW